MNRWYWGAIVCVILCAITAVMPAYETEDGYGVWFWQIGRGWNNRDANGNPTHDDLGNRIRPNYVRLGALYAFGAGATALAIAGFFSPRRRRSAPPSPS
jgi:hypothetical protein